MTTRHIPSFDGVRLAVHQLGEGPAVLLLHGLFSSAHVNWIKFGTAAAVAATGHRVIMPDFRGHGASAAPTDPASWPDDVLTRDTRHLIGALGLGEDLCIAGFSLGARTTARLLATGTPARRAMLAGMGLEGLTTWARRRDFFLDTISLRDSVRPGDPHYFAVQFMKTMRIDPAAATLLLGSIPDAPISLGRIAIPVTVLCGDQDRDNGSPDALASALPDATLVTVTGTHMSSVSHPSFVRGLAAWTAA